MYSLHCLAVLSVVTLYQCLAASDRPAECPQTASLQLKVDNDGTTASISVAYSSHVEHQEGKILYCECTYKGDMGTAIQAMPDVKTKIVFYFGTFAYMNKVYALDYCHHEGKANMQAACKKMKKGIVTTIAGTDYFVTPK
ncbi:hypothetical protein HELRODRAFT_177954 [Helobdella robusta]|uniref:MD-2-related lipid-recognition domain-containing protein n=1 Tax=Helobdella robusta TaxID=6412 RepID=T1FCI4_HELRO|nr:hypothetical protein HELRODRAFT_177954 [Helobdella robusta]ESN97522.1 hypothetical protein HELRODRAFT_177954 [Helobdella robusta]